MAPPRGRVARAGSRRTSSRRDDHRGRTRAGVTIGPPPFGPDADRLGAVSGTVVYWAAGRSCFRRPDDRHFPGGPAVPRSVGIPVGARKVCQACRFVGPSGGKTASLCSPPNTLSTASRGLRGSPAPHLTGLRPVSAGQRPDPDSACGKGKSGQRRVVRLGVSFAGIDPSLAGGLPAVPAWGRTQTAGGRRS